MNKRRITAWMLCAVMLLTSAFSLPPSFAAAEGDSAGKQAAEPRESAAPYAEENDAGSRGIERSGRVLYVSASGSDKRGDGSREAPYASVQKAYDESDSGDSIVVSGTVVIDDYTNILRFSEEKAVELSGENDGVILYDGDQNIDPASAIIKITAGSLNLRDITVKMPDVRGKNGRVLYVSGSAEVTVGAGAVVENGYLAASSGNIFVTGGGTVTLDGGTVRNGYLAISNADAYGAGICVDDGGSLYMRSGEVSANTARATVSSYRTFGGGIAVMAGGCFEMTGGRITQNEAETGGAGVYVAEGSSVVFNGASAGGNFVIRENYLRGGQEGCENNLYFAEDATAELSGSMAGADIGVTCEDDYYGRVVFRPGGQNTISASDESAFVYDGGFYDIRLDSFVGKGENLILWHWTVGVEIIGDHITSSNDAEETPADLDYETTILPEEGYRLPERIHVTTGDKTLGEEEYVWEPETGKILIESEKIEGDIVIRIDADGLHQVSVECSNVSADLSSAAVTQKEEISVRFTRVPKYGLPLKEDVAVQGKCSSEYDEERGVLTVRNVTEDIVIRACGSKISHTVTFDPDGGRLEEGEESKEFFESDPTLGELPEPEKPGYHFDGWFDPEGNRVTEDTPNDNEDDITLKAHWSARTDISYTIRHYVELVDSGVNPETESTDETAVSVADKDGKVHVYYLYTVSEYHDGVADSVQSMNDHLMDCSEASMNTLSIEGFVLADFNQYEYRIEPDGSTVIDWYYDRADITVSYDGNGGTASQAQTSVKYGSCYGTLASADREGYTFDGWYTEANSGSQVTPEKICTSTQPVTLYAHWKAKGDTPYTVYHRTQNLTNNIVEENHDLSNTTLIQTDTLYGTSDCIVDLYGMAVDGFQCCPDNLYQVYINADGTASAVLYYDRAFTMVSYDANGGKILSDEELKTKVYYEGVLGTVQAQPQREGYRFTGWYTEADGGRKVDADTGYDRIAPNGEKEVTLYAHWETNGGGSSPDPDPPAESGSSGGGGSGGGTQKKPLLTGEHIKYMQGYPDGTFRADGNMTRAEAAQMFYNLLNEKIVAPCFYKDVSASAWYADAAGALSELEIIEGYDDGSFRPDAEITRAEFVAMASRFFETEPDAECGFSDVKTDGWYYVVIASATKKGWLTGYSDGTFRPENKISRAEVAAVTNRVLERSADEDYLQKASEDDELNRELKLFPDLREGHWAYYTVLEAANAHDYERSEAGEEFWTGLKA